MVPKISQQWFEKKEGKMNIIVDSLGSPKIIFKLGFGVDNSGLTLTNINLGGKIIIPAGSLVSVTVSGNPITTSKSGLGGIFSINNAMASLQRLTIFSIPPTLRGQNDFLSDYLVQIADHQVYTIMNTSTHHFLARAIEEVPQDLWTQAH